MRIAQFENSVVGRDDNVRLFFIITNDDYSGGHSFIRSYSSQVFEWGNSSEWLFNDRIILNSFRFYKKGL